MSYSSKVLTSLGEAGDDWRVYPVVPSFAAEPDLKHHYFGEYTAVHWYKNSENERLGAVLRYNKPEGGKITPTLTYAQNLKTGVSSWVWQGFQKPRPIYGLELLALEPEKPVIIFEGEKTTDSARRDKYFYDYVCIAYPNGCRSWKHVDFTALTGKIVYLWPDNDEQGKAAFAELAEHLTGISKEVRLIELPCAPDGHEPLLSGWDVADEIPNWLSPWKILEQTKIIAKPAVESPARSDKINLDAEVKKLSVMPELEYDRCRKDKAKELSVSLSALDKAVYKERKQREGGNKGSITLQAPEAWHEAVNGLQLYDDLIKIINRHIILPDGADVTVALWAIYSYMVDCFRISPRLYISSPEKQCGKSTLLIIISRLVLKPLTTANITSAGIFRAIEAFKPTLLIDEADTFVNNHNEDLKGILNSGHNKESAFVIRTEGDNHDTRLFSTWGAVVIAGIGNIPDTLESRSIKIQMRRRKPDEKVDKLRLDRKDDFEILARKIARWADDNNYAISKADPIVPDTLNDRVADNWRPLIAIAETLGGKLADKARKVALSLHKPDTATELSFKAQLLADIKEAFESTNRLWIKSSELAEKLSEIEESPWCEYNKGRHITPHQIARLLKGYGIKPVLRKYAGVSERGYSIDDFADAFGRYLSDIQLLNVSFSPDTPFQSVTPLPLADRADYRGNQSVTFGNQVTLGKQSRPAICLDGNGVTLQMPPAGKEISFEEVIL